MYQSKTLIRIERAHVDNGEKKIGVYIYLSLSLVTGQWIVIEHANIISSYHNSIVRDIVDDLFLRDTNLPIKMPHILRMFMFNIDFSRFQYVSHCYDDQ